MKTVANQARMVTVSIQQDGSIRQLVGHDSIVLVSDPDSVQHRASHVEPVNQVLRKLFYGLRNAGLISLSRCIPCLWRVNLAPIDGPVLPETFRDRESAIQHEIEYLTNNWL